MGVREKLVELLTEFYGVDPMYHGVDANALAGHLITHGVTVQEWISVEDRLPDKSGEYIILNDAGHQDVLMYSKKYKLFNACDFFEEYFVVKNSIKVTHWMPLLEMPKGE